MIYYLLLLLYPFVATSQSIAQKQYTLREKSPNVLLFSALTSLIALFFFLITSRFDLQFDARLVPYALGFAVCYASAWAGTVFALRFGSMALSTLIISCSLIFPTTYGLILGEAATPTVLTGIFMILAAIVLVNLKSGGKEKFSLKWFFCTMVAFIGNGVCSIMQNMQKRALGESFTHEFMIIALSASFVLLLIAACLTSKSVRSDFKTCLPYASANGVANALVNFLMMTMIGNIPNTVLYPSVSALNMLLAFLLAFIAYKERFSLIQYIGYAMGAFSIVLLNL